MLEQIQVGELKDPQIFITKRMRNLFDQVRGDIPQLKNIENKQFFMYALMLGYRAKHRVSIKPQELHDNGFFREKNFTATERAIFYSIAVEAEKNIEVILDTRKVIQISQEYAEGGFLVLKELLFSHGSLENKLSEILQPYIDSDLQNDQPA